MAARQLSHIEMTWLPQGCAKKMETTLFLPSHGENVDRSEGLRKEERRLKRRRKKKEVREASLIHTATVLNVCEIPTNRVVNVCFAFDALSYGTTLGTYTVNIYVTTNLNAVSNSLFGGYHGFESRSRSAVNRH